MIKCNILISCYTFYLNMLIFLYKSFYWEIFFLKKWLALSHPSLFMKKNVLPWRYCLLSLITCYRTFVWNLNFSVCLFSSFKKKSYCVPCMYFFSLFLWESQNSKWKHFQAFTRLFIVFFCVNQRYFLLFRKPPLPHTSLVWTHKLFIS